MGTCYKCILDTLPSKHGLRDIPVSPSGAVLCAVAEATTNRVDFRYSSVNESPCAFVLNLSFYFAFGFIISHTVYTRNKTHTHYMLDTCSIYCAARPPPPPPCARAGAPEGAEKKQNASNTPLFRKSVHVLCAGIYFRETFCY